MNNGGVPIIERGRRGRKVLGLMTTLRRKKGWGEGHSEAR